MFNLQNICINRNVMP